MRSIITLPWPPTMNTYWRHVGHKVLISADGRSYRKIVGMELMVQRAKRFKDMPLLVEIDAYPPDRRKRDLDNLFKPVLDALAHGGMYDDDSQISELSIKRMPVTQQGKLVIRITGRVEGSLF